MDAGDRMMTRGKLDRLIVHQGNKRADNESRSASRESRQLVTKTLSRPGWHHQKHVTTVGCRSAHRFLVRPERSEAEVLVKQGG